MINVLKACLAIAVSPVALVADLVTLPSSAWDDRAPFGRTGRMLDAAGRCITAATNPTAPKGHHEQT